MSLDAFVSFYRRATLVCGAVIIMSIGAGCSLFGKDEPDNAADGGVGTMCMSNADCAVPFVCAGGSCQLEGSVGLGGSCSASRDCAAELFCAANGVCAPSGDGMVGDPCSTGAECLEDLICQSFGFGGSCAEAGTADLGQSCSELTDCIAGLACGVDGTCQPPIIAYPPFTGVECDTDNAPFRAYFEIPRPNDPPAEFYRFPFPNDGRVDASGNLDMSDFPRPGPTPLGIDLISLYVDALVDDFSGFSSVAAVTFRFATEFDFDSLGMNGENIHYVDVTPSVPENGNDRTRRFGYSTGRGLFQCQHTLVVRNNAYQPLLPGHTYAVYMTTDIRGAGQETPSIPADLQAVLGTTRPAEEAVGHVWDQYTPFRDYLTNESIAANTIAGVTVFTVQDTTGNAEALATAVEAAQLPGLSDLTLCDGSNVSPCDDGGSRTCGSVDGDFYEIHGRYSVPNYQQGTAPFEFPPAGGNIEYDGTGVPQQNGTTDVCFALTIPKNASMPVSGWPLVVYAHGTGGSFKGAVTNGVARTLATSSQPTAMFSYDGVVHGERKNGSTRDSDGLMFNVVNPQAARDNHLQGAVDVLQALRLPQMALFNVGGVGDVDFDPANVFYFGHSQGSNVGIPAEAVSDYTPGSIFSGAGGFLTDGILNKTSPVDAKAGLEFLLGEPIGRTHPMMVIWQTYFDSVDTINYGPLLLARPPAGVASQDVYMSWGSDDTFSPNGTLDSMANSFGIPVANPVVSGNNIVNGTIVRPISENKSTGDGPMRTAALFQYQPDSYDGHFVATRHSNAIADWLAFITSQISVGTSTVP